MAIYFANDFFGSGRTRANKNIKIKRRAAPRPQRTAQQPIDATAGGHVFLKVGRLTV